ncbi:PTS system mannose/fructose/sorbose family transporter subunit IID [Olsenella sp. YH-ols2217]|uniref:PTS system mannose/fructose/sorbose family transporter subunit IID n=1 Tax=Kribbibacterium absianum TaxID=3044210 RepID=A0ABT6ZMM1_9ACTN|nr:MULTISPECIES: PTS system mannose/fructose/sorbose family transporter subunit IID [unclassified Olsenella]MDJ1122286.1 PTS system mannose/fructose/sorbose family transporter subunit IID [Olsenella sp. YH-ols2216]MDJ1130300.1 PTS system mannose/fructose/sorbose family transporter subunit IID [Olsenella sp. YH-ols2217]
MDAVLLLQSLVCGLLCYLGSGESPWLFGITGSFYTVGRPLVAGLLLGLLFGDVAAGVLCGVAVQAVFIANMNSGGATNADVVYASYGGIGLALATDADPAVAVTLSVLIGQTLGLLIYNAKMAAYSFFNNRFEDAVERLDYRGLTLWHLVIPQLTSCALRAVPIAALVCLGQGVLDALLAAVPDVALHIIAVIGGLLPALGIAILMSVVLQKPPELVFFFGGFVLAAYLDLPMLAVVLVAAVVAYLMYVASGCGDLAGLAGPDTPPPSPSERGADSRLTHRELVRLWLRWAFFGLASMSFEKLEACGFCFSMEPLAHRYYADDPEGARALLRRHAIFYNTEPQIGSVVNGIAVSLEEEKALGADVPDDLPVTVKTALMGPLAGIGDTIVQGVVVPTLLSIGMGLAAGGSVLGPVFYILSYMTFGVAVSYVCFMAGHRLGAGAMDAVLGEGVKRVTGALNVLGIMVVGALAATNVDVTTPLVIPSGDGTTALQTLLDSIFPQLLPMLAVLVTWHLIAHRKLSATRAILVLCAAAIVLGGLGIL